MAGKWTKQHHRLAIFFISKSRVGNVFNNKEDIKKEEQHPRRMIKWIHYTKLKENPGQYCPERDKEEIEALADLIEAAGEVIQNLSVYNIGDRGI